MPNLIIQIGQALSWNVKNISTNLITTAVKLVQEIVNALPQIITVLAVLPILITRINKWINNNNKYT